MEKYKDIMEMSEEELIDYLHSKPYHTTKEIRKMHKAFKKHGRLGFPISDRYPYLPVYLSIIALLISIAVIVIPVISQILS